MLGGVCELLHITHATYKLATGVVWEHHFVNWVVLFYHSMLKSNLSTAC